MKNAIVTGADRGIGFAIAKQLVNDGYCVCANYLTKFNMNDFIKSINEIEAAKRIKTFRADISDFSQIKDLFRFVEETMGAIHLLVNNAGVTEFGPFLEATPEQWDKIVSTDWKGAYFCTQLAAQNMIRNNQAGTIINISSNHADGCWPEASIYGPVKCALTKFGMHAALELAPHRIRVITLSPGYTDTGWGSSEVHKLIRTKIPLGRFATPNEIASIIPVLDSERFSYATGCCFTIDGGALLPVVTENNFDH